MASRSPSPLLPVQATKSGRSNSPGRLYSALPTMRRRRLKRIFIILSAVISFVLLFPFSYSRLPPHYAELQRTMREHGIGNTHKEKVFIAANIIQADLIRGTWGKSLLQLVDYIGPENTFVSIYENDAPLAAGHALEELKRKLPCNYSIVHGDHIPLGSFPTVVLPNGQPRVKRITYLAEIRNRLLRPLDDRETAPLGSIPANHTATRFDRILFLNDIYFDPMDAVQLLFSTNQNPVTGRAEYQAACGLDFIRGIQMYDTFVVRDSDGYRVGSSMFYPWFTQRGSGTSRRAMLQQKDAVPVTSCWSGIAAYDATPFLRQAVLDGRPESRMSDTANFIAVQAAELYNPDKTIAPLRFRALHDLFWEASECCLINADIISRTAVNREPQIFVNPYIRVAYSRLEYVFAHTLRRFELLLVPLGYIADHIGYFEENPRRRDIPGRWTTHERWTFKRSELNGEQMHRNLSGYEPQDFFGEFAYTAEIAKPGAYCGLERVFVMLPDVRKANAGGSGKNWEVFRRPST